MMAASGAGRLRFAGALLLAATFAVGGLGGYSLAQLAGRGDAAQVLKLFRSAAISAARRARRTFSAPIIMPGSSIVGTWMTFFAGSWPAVVTPHRRTSRSARIASATAPATTRASA